MISIANEKLGSTAIVNASYQMCSHALPDTQGDNSKFQVFIQMSTADKAMFHWPHCTSPTDLKFC